MEWSFYKVWKRTEWNKYEETRVISAECTFFFKQPLIIQYWIEKVSFLRFGILWKLFECLSFEIILFLFLQILLSIIVIIYIIKNCLLKIIPSLFLFLIFIYPDFILLFLFYNNTKYRNIEDQESQRNLTFK